MDHSTDANEEDSQCRTKSVLHEDEEQTKFQCPPKKHSRSPFACNFQARIDIFALCILGGFIPLQ